MAAAAAAAAAMLVAAIRSDMLEPTPEDTPDVECLPVPAEAWKEDLLLKSMNTKIGTPEVSRYGHRWVKVK